MSCTQTTWRVAPVAGYARLSFDLLMGGASPPVDVYAISGDDDKPQMLASRSHTIAREKLKEWKAIGLRSLLVRESDLKELVEKMESALDDILANQQLPPAERYRVLQCVVCSSLKERLWWTGADAWVTASKRVASQMVDLLCGPEVVVGALFDIAAHDTSTLVHATNVAAYAVLLGQALGEGRDELRQIALGAMLHDFGMRFVPQELRDKKGKLDEHERRIIEKHPTFGYEALVGQPGIGFGQLMMAYQHHEWVNGGGYPVAVEGSEIHPWAKLLAVVDVFDAATARRPHREALPPERALQRLTESAGTQLDPEVVRCWISVFKG